RGVHRRERVVERLPQAVRGRLGRPLVEEAQAHGNRFAVVLAVTAGAAEALGARVGVHRLVTTEGIHVAEAALRDPELGEVGDVQRPEGGRAVRVVEDTGGAGDANG